jgi:hypothetical protein
MFVQDGPPKLQQRTNDVGGGVTTDGPPALHRVHRELAMPPMPSMLSFRDAGPPPLQTRAAADVGPPPLQSANGSAAADAPPALRPITPPPQLQRVRRDSSSAVGPKSVDTVVR